MIVRAGLAVAGVASLLAACDAPEHPLSVSFQTRFGDERIGCEMATADGVMLNDLLFFVHDLQVSDGNGQWHNASIEIIAPYQLENLALIDLETGTGSCRNGNPDLKSEITATSPIADPVGIRFTVGVPFELNHINPATAEPPLTYTIMHWHWQAGYKFIRAGLTSPDGTGFLHLGSTECLGTIGDISGCNFPNRAIVELPNFDPSQQSVQVDMRALMGAVPQGSCMAERDDPDCAQPFVALGLSDELVQSVFQP